MARLLPPVVSPLVGLARVTFKILCTSAGPGRTFRCILSMAYTAEALSEYVTKANPRWDLAVGQHVEDVKGQVPGSPTHWKTRMLRRTYDEQDPAVKLRLLYLQMGQRH